MSDYTAPSMSSKDLAALASALEVLSANRAKTGLDIGIYQDPEIKIGDNGIKFLLVWDESEFQYRVEERHQ